MPLATVVRAIRAARITPLPLAPDVVLGALDVGGEVLPVFSLRRRFRLPEQPVDPSQYFILATTSQRQVALLVDAVTGVLSLPARTVIDPATLAPDLPHIRGIIAQADGLVLIQDLEQFLSPEESSELDRALLDVGDVARGPG